MRDRQLRRYRMKKHVPNCIARVARFGCNLLIKRCLTRSYSNELYTKMCLGVRSVSWRELARGRPRAYVLVLRGEVGVGAR